MSTQLVSGINFQGMSPATDDEALNPNQAAYAQDVELYRGVIRATRADTEFRGDIFDFDENQLSEKTRVFALPGTESGSFVIVSSVFDHVASTVNINGELEVWMSGANTDAIRFRRARSGSGFLVYDVMAYTDIAVPKPNITIIRADENTDITRYATMRLAFVYADGFETTMGPSSDEFGYVPGDEIEIGAIDISGSVVVPSVIRVYISVASSDGAEMRYFGEITESEYPTTFSLPNDITGEVMEDYDTLPTDVRCVCAAPWGGFAFTTEKKPGVLQFTDSLMMRKVLPEYEMNLGGSVKALLMGTTCIFALCDDAGPFVVAGTALPNLILYTGSVISPLVSTPAGAAVYNDTCLFAGAHGLMLLSAGGLVSPFTEKPVFSREQWEELAPEGIALTFTSDGSVVFASPTGVTGVLEKYGLVWKSGVRKAFAVLPHDKSIVYI